MTLFENKGGNVFKLKETDYKLDLKDIDKKMSLKEYISYITEDGDFEIEVFDYKITAYSGEIVVDSTENEFNIIKDKLVVIVDYIRNRDVISREISIPLSTLGTINTINSSFDWRDNDLNLHQITLWN